MLELTIPARRYFNSKTEEVVNVPETYLKMEHSLISIKKWEEKWHVPFLDKDTEKTPEMYIDYLKCMTINSNVDPLVYQYIPEEYADQIAAYIKDPMTASWIGDKNEKKRKGGLSSTQKLTAELIYYWMIAYNIPVEFQKWHINSLIMLIDICNEESKPEKEKRRSQKEINARTAATNKYRREMYKARKGLK